MDVLYITHVLNKILYLIDIKSILNLSSTCHYLNEFIKKNHNLIVSKSITEYFLRTQTCKHLILNPFDIETDVLKYFKPFDKFEHLIKNRESVFKTFYKEECKILIQENQQEINYWHNAQLDVIHKTDIKCQQHWLNEIEDQIFRLIYYDIPIYIESSKLSHTNIIKILMNMDHIYIYKDLYCTTILTIKDVEIPFDSSLIVYVKDRHLLTDNLEMYAFSMYYFIDFLFKCILSRDFFIDF